MNYLDLFSGGGGFHQGLVQAGFKFDWCGHSEVDKYAEQVYHKHFPESRCLGDIGKIEVLCSSGNASKLSTNADGDSRVSSGRESEQPPIGRNNASCNGGDERDDTKTTITTTNGTHTINGKINLITFGFPCQDLSVAGKRRGLHASRSGLFFEAMRIVESAKPDIFIFENVKGLLSSSGGRDFEIVLRTIADLGIYDCEWQLVNTRWVLPQNRERIFFIGHRKDLQFKGVFPIIPDNYLGEAQYEKVYEMSQGLSEVIKAFLERQERQAQSDIMVQELFQRIQQDIQQKTSTEITRETEEIRQFGKENLSETQAISTRASGNDKSGNLFDVVQIPTEEMLLLWHRGSKATYRFRFLQPEDLTFDDRSDGFPAWLRARELSSLLLSVQFYKGKLLYSIGDGRNWTKIYSQEVGRCQQSLSDILEGQVDPKYFLSEKAMEFIEKRTTENQGKRSAPLLFDQD